jgi:hypothetical protein
MGNVFSQLHHKGMRVKNFEFHTRVKDINISYFGQMEKPISSENNEKVNTSKKKYRKVNALHSFNIAVEL